MYDYICIHIYICMYVYIYTYMFFRQNHQCFFGTSHIPGHPWFSIQIYPDLSRSGEIPKP